MMRSIFRKRWVIIVLPQVMVAGAALVAITAEMPVPTILLAYTLLIGFGAIIIFWSIFFLSFPRISTYLLISLFALYRIGQIVFIVIVIIAIWSLFNSFGDLFHWLLVGFGLLESSVHFVIRWMDGNGKLFVQRPVHTWLGGAAGVALQHANRVMKIRKDSV